MCMTVKSLEWLNHEDKFFKGRWQPLPWTSQTQTQRPALLSLSGRELARALTCTRDFQRNLYFSCSEKSLWFKFNALAFSSHPNRTPLHYQRNLQTTHNKNPNKQNTYNSQDDYIRSLRRKGWDQRFVRSGRGAEAGWLTVGATNSSY